MLQSRQRSLRRTIGTGTPRRKTRRTDRNWTLRAILCVASGAGRRAVPRAGPPGRLHSQLLSQLHRELRWVSMKRLRARASPPVAMRAPLRLMIRAFQLHSQLFSQLLSQLHCKLPSQLLSQLHCQLHCQLRSQLFS